MGSTGGMDPPGITRDRYCRSNVTIESCAALFIELEPLEDLRCCFMFWRGYPFDTAFQSSRIKRLRDLRPGNQVLCDGRHRTIKRVEIYR